MKERVANLGFGKNDALVFSITVLCEGFQMRLHLPKRSKVYPVAELNRPVFIPHLKTFSVRADTALQEAFAFKMGHSPPKRSFINAVTPIDHRAVGRKDNPLP